MTETATAAPQESLPLAGIRVLDVGQAAVGPVSAMYLSMLGADVVKVERPEGDAVRRTAPLMGGVGLTFLGQNFGKDGVRLDLKTEHDRLIFERAIGWADVLIENFRGRHVMARFGYPYDAVRRINPRLVYLQSSAYGNAGPLLGMISNEWVTEALSGASSVTGEAIPEIARGTGFFDWTGANMNTIAMLSGLVVARRGDGVFLETSQFGSALFAGLTRFAEYAATGTRPVPRGTSSEFCVPDGVFPASDGYLTVTVRDDGEWRALRSTLGDGFAAAVGDTVADRLAHRDDIDRALRERIAGAPVDHWISTLASAGVPCGPCLAPNVILTSALTDVTTMLGRHVAMNGLVGSVITPKGTIKMPAPPWLLSAGWAVHGSPAPDIGQHQAQVLARLTHGSPGDPSPATGRADRVPTHIGHTLDRLTVLEIGDGAPAAAAGLVLQRLGATVTKYVPSGGDRLSRQPPLRDGVGVVFRALTDGKTLVEGDSADSALPALLAAHDVLVFDEEVGRRLNVAELNDIANGAGARTGQLPDITCVIRGWGTRGPLAGLPCTEVAAQLASGLTAQLGTPGTSHVRMGFDVVSMNTGVVAAQTVLAEIVAGTKRGPNVNEVSMLRTALALNQWAIENESGWDDERGTSIEAYQWQENHGFAYLREDGTVGRCHIEFRFNAENWIKFIESVGASAVLADPALGGVRQILRHADQLPGALEPYMATKSMAALRAIVEPLNGAVVPVQTVPEVLVHEQTRALGVLALVDGRLRLDLPIQVMDPGTDLPVPR